MSFCSHNFRIATNTDIFQRLLLNSDPLISLSRKLPKKKVHHLTEEMQSLIQIDIAPEEDENTSNDQTTDSSDYSDSE